MTGVAIYSELTPDVASAARAAAERIRAHMSFVSGALIEIGRDLNATKAHLHHGQFLAWIDTEFEMSERTARNLMLVAREFGDKSARFADLPRTVLYALAAPSTPEPVRVEVERMVEAGERVDLETVMALKRELLDAKQDGKAAKQDAKVQKSEAQRAREERDSFRNQLDFANSKLRQLAEEVERLKQDGVIHSYPAEPVPVVAPYRPSVEPVAPPTIAAHFQRSAAKNIARIIKDNLHADTVLRIAGWVSETTVEEIADALNAQGDEAAA